MGAYVHGDDCLIAAHHSRYYTWTVLNTQLILILNGLDVHNCCLYCGIIMFDVGMYKESMLCPNANPKECVQTSLYVTTVCAGFLIGSPNLQAVPHHNGRMKHSE